MTEPLPGAAIFDAVQATASMDDDLDGAALVGFVTVAEWSDGNGQRWLSTTTWDISDKPPPQWTVRGWLHEALYFSGTPGEDEDEE